jgi:acyl carrier protein
MSDAFVTKLAAMARVDPAALTDETPIVPEQWDSVDVLDLIAAIDEVDGVTVAMKELNRCSTIGELRALIARAKSEGDVRS